MKQSSLRIICDRNIKRKSLLSDLTTKNGNKALFILRNRAHSFVVFCGRELGSLADNWAHELSLHFRYYMEKTALSSR